MRMHHPLPSGAHVRLRLPVRADTRGLRALVGAETAERLLHFDPRRRAVMCAVSFEEVLGVGAIELRPGARPDVLEARDEEVAALLESVLTARAEAVHQPAPVRMRGRWPGRSKLSPRSARRSSRSGRS
jgi:hypothetical protein